MEPASDEEEAASSSGPAPRSAPLASARPAGEIFAVTKPPSKRLPPPPVSGKAAGKRRNTNLPVTTVRAGTSSSKVSPAANYQVERPDKRARGNDLLDARVALDPDENYNENERALTEFIRLHPMLSYARVLPRRPAPTHQPKLKRSVCGHADWTPPPSACSRASPR